MSKLVVTEAGLKLQKDIIKEVGMPNLGKNRLSLVEDNNSPNNTLMLNLKTTRTHDDDNIFFITKSHSFSPNKPRSSLIEQHLINEQPNGIPLSIAERKKKQAYDEILKNSPYINQKVKKMNKDMEKYVPKYKSNNLSPSLGRSSMNDVMNGSNSVKMTNSISISNLYTSTSNQDNIFHTFTNDESTMTKKDDFMINQHHKILHMESVIEKIVDRYKESKNRLDKIQRDIDKQYQQKVKIIMDKNHKPPEFLENIKKNNNDAIQIIAHKTRAQFRQKNRIESQFKEKYLKYWKKVHADEPKSAKKTSHIVDKE